MSPGRGPRAHRVAALLGVLALLTAAAGCADGTEGEPAPEETRPVTATPEELEPLIVDEVASGLPRLPDEAISPPAGAKRVEDVAGYSDDPARERAVLADYGYRHGWERFWGAGTGEGPQTGVFVDSFAGPEGAAAYAEDLARNDAEHYGGLLSEGSPELPEDCRRLVVDAARPDRGLSGPAVMAWCARGTFAVSVTAVAGSVDAASAEVGAVVVEQLDRLPAG